ncbi:hypothetical protein GTP23_06465 [Pseudoduganella sp. FT93W]|uniref:Uncharacterized protein n=1 Tax=Duganella fentianensis TaxID=2692177 RepID=A0A845HY99_9BURK|nr:hypothetical protein [Duganella fentianensis]MYN44717.1 hypothetical protein [Duganella fentianensis]
MDTPPLVANAMQIAEEHTYRCLGKFFVVFSSIEFKLTLSLTNALFDLKVNPSRPIEQIPFQEKLDGFVHAQIMDSHEDEVHYQQCFAWYRKADILREARNRFAHGRWAFLHHEPHIVHVAGYPDGKQSELRLSLEDLSDLIEVAIAVNVGLERLLNKHE